MPLGRMTNDSSTTVLHSVLIISSYQLLETKQSDEQGGLRLFSGGFYLVFLSFFSMVLIFLSQWSCINRALLCSGCWDKLSFFEAVFHMPEAFYGMLSFCPANLRISSKMLLPCFLLELGRELVSWSSFTWEKSSFTELSKVIRFLQVFSQELLETCRTRTYVLTDKNLRSIIFLTGEGEKIQMKTIASS